VENDHHRRAPAPALEVREEVLAVYAEADSRPVERACVRRTACCRFRLTGKTPWLTRGEAVVAARAWRAKGRRRIEPRPDGACPFLDDATGGCGVYAARPLACRTHYCREAGGPVPRADVVDLVRKLERIGRRLGGDGAHPLFEAVERELSSGR